MAVEFPVHMGVAFDLDVPLHLVVMAVCLESAAGHVEFEIGNPHHVCVCGITRRTSGGVAVRFIRWFCGETKRIEKQTESE